MGAAVADNCTLVEVSSEGEVKLAMMPLGGSVQPSKLKTGAPTWACAALLPSSGVMMSFSSASSPLAGTSTSQSIQLGRSCAER